MANKLAKLKMPAKRGNEKDLDLSQLDESSPEEDSELPESPAEDGEEMAELDAPLEGAPSSELEAVSDDDLMAEIKKRGLLSQLEEGGEEGDELPPAPESDDEEDDQSKYY
jgi:hypothetical protein